MVDLIGFTDAKDVIKLSEEEVKYADDASEEVLQKVEHPLVAYMAANTQRVLGFKNGFLTPPSCEESIAVPCLNFFILRNRQRIIKNKGKEVPEGVREAIGVLEEMHCCDDKSCRYHPEHKDPRPEDNPKVRACLCTPPIFPPHN